MSRFWHPFSNLATTERERLVLVEGEGATVVDEEGNEYFDATAGLWYCASGHGRAEIAAAVAEQAERLASYSCFETYATEPTLRLADRVAAAVPLDDSRVFFTSGGSDGIDTAAKMVRRHFVLRGEPERTVMISREGAYHGTHGFGTSLGGIGANRDGWGELVRDVEQITPFNAEALDEKIREVGPERVAAFFAEPVIGAGGVFPPPPDFLAEAAAVCAEHGVLLVCDEVVTGVGRTGRWSACELYGVRPDLMILAKALTSGYLPLGAVVASGRVAEPFLAGAGAPFKHGYTYSGHAAACAAAHANLDLIEAEQLIERADGLAARLPDLLGWLQRVDGISEVRMVGLTAGIQLDAERLAERGSTAADVVLACRRHGQLTRLLASGALHFSPPFVSSEAEIRRFADSVAESVAELAPA